MDQILVIKKFSFKNYSYQNFNLDEDRILKEVLPIDLEHFLFQLHSKFSESRKKLLNDRYTLAHEIDNGYIPTFPEETKSIRHSNWLVAEAPPDLQKRHVEITGPADAKMIVNALNSSADIFMADLEDALSPTWENIVCGHYSLKLESEQKLNVHLNDKSYSVHNSSTTLKVRPRGLHLDEKNVLINGQSISASLFDFGVNFFLCAQNRIKRHTGPYYYLPKMESYWEAKWWNDVFEWSQGYLKIPSGTIKATVLIETCLAALQMDEILFHLKDHICGLNAGRWDYIFSFIKKFKNHSNFIFPDRSQITMTTDFMKHYCELLVKTCHHRGAHAIGGMAAFIPNRKEPEVTEKALIQITQDKTREVELGFDGTWVAHPDLIPVARKPFQSILGTQPHQKLKQKEIQITSKQILDVAIPNGKITEKGVRTNINVSLLYIDRWLSGIGAAALYNLMEDAATAEISRSEIWQWLRYKANIIELGPMTETIYQTLKADELRSIRSQFSTSHLELAEKILDRLVLSNEFKDFLTTDCYQNLS